MLDTFLETFEMPEKDRKIPELAVPRLSKYHRALLEAGDKKVISSEELAGCTGFSAAQIRKDLTYFGQFGRPGLGYDIQELRQALARILGIDRTWNVALIGVGNLGAALLGYKGFKRQRFHLVAAFDKDPAKTGRVVEGVPVMPLERLPHMVRAENIRMIIITVPAAAAQDAADLLAGTGVKAILNFAPVRLKVPGHMLVHNIDVAIEMERLSFLTARAEST